VLDVLENSPATDAGIAVGDVLESVDGVPVDRLTLPAINDMFEKPVAYALTLRRGARTFTATLTPRRMI
jgi:C-terminal processing protease CtpA/Prc